MVGWTGKNVRDIEAADQPGFEDEPFKRLGQEQPQSSQRSSMPLAAPLRSNALKTLSGML